jgi:hypothetical protein
MASPKSALPNVSSPWPGPRLLVPISVNVMLQSPHSAVQNWSVTPVSYVSVNNFVDPGPEPFNLSTERLVPGTTTGQVLSGASISWALPSALTRADKDTGAFPPVPNRWLVVRRALIGGSPTYAAWVIESDYQSSDPTAATNQYPTGLAPNPNPSVENPDQLALAYFGRAVPLGQWPLPDTPTAPLQPPLTAIGPGDPSFAAFQPGTPNVMAFNDLLTNMPCATLTYWVAGWYAQPALDPLYSLAGGGANGNGAGWTSEAEWLDLTQQLGWSVGTDADLAAAATAAKAWSKAKGLTVPGTGDQQLYPAQILCHGMSYNAKWVGQNIAQPTGIPSDPTVTIGVGRTTIEAFGAMVAAQINQANPGTGDEVARTIQALQYHLLDTDFDHTGAPSLDEAIHDGAFGSRRGGTIWTLAPAQGSGSAPLADNLVQALVALNGAQAAADEAARQLAAGQQELYTAWYRACAQFPPPSTPESLGYLTSLQTQVVPGLLSSTQSLTTARDTAESTLRALLTPLKQPPTLKATPATPFWSPLDPVLSISGLGRAFAFGDDTGPRPDDVLFCRFSGQALTGIHAGSAQGPLVTGASLLGGFPANASAPYDIGDVAAECLLLDTAVAPQIAQAAGGVDAGYVQKQQTIVWNGTSQFDQQSIAEAAGLVGTVPCVIASVAWTNAWVPLYLDWEVSWTQFDPGQWSFNGEDFTLTNPSPAAPVSFSGRAVLTPNAGNDLYRTILQYADNNPSDTKAQKLKAAIADLPDADVLSQRLSGFGSFLQTLQINTASFLPSAAAIPSALLQATAGTIPYSAASQFYPVPAGQFSVTRLWVIDAFGQILPVIDNPPPPTVVSTYYAPPIQASAQSATTLGQLPPRVIQPTRVEFDLLDAGDSSRIVAQDPAANPVCGWLLPNHLDQGVSVYDQNGAAIGEVVVAGTAPSQYLLWRPTPGNPQGLGEPPAIANPLLADVINTYLLNASGGVANLQRLLTVIDETLSSFRPPIAGSVTSMAAAIGNPVAVVSAKVTVRLNGAPALSQFIASSTVQNTIGDAATFNVPFQLGSILLPEDGLLGYFVNGDFNTLLSLAPSTATALDAVPANAAQFTVPLVSQDPSAPLVLLMDPRGSVHVSTGCLPVLEVKLPQRDVAAALANMLVTFQAGPVLTDLPNIRIPVPSLGKGTWTWLDRPTPSTLAAPARLTAADAKPRAPTTPLSVVEGWLQLTGALDEQDG